MVCGPTGLHYDVNALWTDKIALEHLSSQATTLDDFPILICGSEFKYILR
jgi:hypothetical protein